MPGPYNLPTDRVTGGPSPAADVNALAAAINESADAATPNVLVLRDAAGRAKVADPLAATDIANASWVAAAIAQAIADLIASSPATLDTLNELAAALGDDPNFATTIANALAAKAPLASPAFTGTPTAPTPSPGDNDTSVATTAFVANAVSPMIDKTMIELKGDLLVGSANDTVARLAVGSNNLMLIADSTQPTGLRWAFTDEFSLGYDQFTAKGTLLIGMAENFPISVAVGPNGTVLTADSAELSGTRWAAPAGLPYKFATRPPVGDWFTSPFFTGAGLSTTTAARPGYFKLPIPIEETMTIDALRFQVGTAGTTETATFTLLDAAGVQIGADLVVSPALTVLNVIELVFGTPRVLTPGLYYIKMEVSGGSLTPRFGAAKVTGPGTGGENSSAAPDNSAFNTVPFLIGNSTTVQFTSPIIYLRRSA